MMQTLHVCASRQTKFSANGLTTEISKGRENIEGKKAHTNAYSHTRQGTHKDEKSIRMGGPILVCGRRKGRNSN